MSSGPVAKVFDLINNNQLVPAETQLGPLLSKFSNDHAVLAAQCLLNFRLGNTDESKAAAIVLGADPALKDSSAINALLHVLQQTGALRELAALYVRTIAILGPDSADSTTAQQNLLNTYIILEDFAGAQKVSTALFKKTGDYRYQYNAMMANIAQVPAEATSHMLLTIATKIVASALQAGHAVHPQTCRMYADLLIRQHMFKEAIAYILSAEGLHLGLQETRFSLLISCLESDAASDNSAKINAVARAAWVLDPDNWTFADKYIQTLQQCDSVVDLPKPNGLKHFGGWHANAKTAALALCKQLQEGVHTAKVLRAPYLAELVLLTPAEAIFREKAVAYCTSFAEKGVCFLDLAMVLDEQNPAHVQACVDALASRTPPAVDERSRALAQHRQSILSLKLALLKAPCDAPVPQVEGLFEACVKQYEESRHLGTELEWSEEGPTDGYLLVAANACLRQYVTSREQGWLVAGLSLVHGMDRRKNNPGILLLTTLMLQGLGLSDHSACHQLDIKSVQLTSLHPVVFQPLVRARAVGTLKTLVSGGEKYFSGCRREIGALRTKIFQHLSWPKMNELASFSSRITRCLPRQEHLVFSAAYALGECQTIKYTAQHLVKRATAVSSALVAALTPDALDAATEEVVGPKTISALWEASLAAGEQMAEDDGEFLKAFIFCGQRSTSVEGFHAAILDKDDRKERRQLCALTAAALLVAHDVVVHQARRAAAKAPKGKKGPAQVDPTAQRELLVAAHGLTPDAIRALPTTSAAVQQLQRFVAAMAVVEEELRTGRTTGADLGAAIKALPMDSLTDLWALVHPIAPVLSALLMVMPSPGPHAAALLAVLEKGKLVLDRTIEDLPKKSWNSAIPLRPEATEGVNQYLRDCEGQSLKALSSLLTDMISDVSASAKRK